MLFQILEKTFELCGATFVLELGQNLIFFKENSKGIVCARDFDHLGKGKKKNIL